MDVALLFPSKYLKSVEFKGREVTLTISAVTLEDLESVNGGVQTKGIVAFEETKKLWVLNRTNGESLKAMFGRETDNWVGKHVSLWPAPYTDPFTGEVGTAIRVKGSPDIDRPVSFDMHMPKKKPIRMTMTKTAERKGKAPAPSNGAESAEHVAAQERKLQTQDQEPGANG